MPTIDLVVNGRLLVFFIAFILQFSIFATPYSLFFNGKILTFTDTQEKSWQWKAGAGRPFSTPKDQSQKNKGPLPEGTYTLQLNKAIFFNRTQSFNSKLKWALNYIAWGDLAIPLKPATTNNMHGRNAFMIHGGGWFIGSKGCIYVYSKSQEVYQVLKTCKTDPQIVVRYGENR